MMKKIPSLFLFFFLLIGTALHGNPFNLLNCESPYTIGDKRFEISSSCGYETGLISDLYCTPLIGFGIMDWLDVRVAITGVHFFEDNTRTPCGYSITTKFKVIQREDFPFNLFPYLSINHVPAEPAIFDVVTRDGLATQLLSPHTDKGLDFTAGLSARLRFVTGPVGVMIPFGAEYSRTILRDYYAPYDESSSKNRIIWYVAPGLVAFDDIFGLTIQNRFTHWFSRGFMYEVTPAITITAPMGLSMSIGVGIPAYADGMVKVIVDFGFTTPSLKALGKESRSEEGEAGW